MKQTAVEWLETEIDNKDMGEISMWIYDFIKQAKEMEKEHIINAWNNAYDKGTRDRLEKVVDPVGDADTYFKETFKSE
jgi:hypothetical protein